MAVNWLFICRLFLLNKRYIKMSTKKLTTKQFDKLTKAEKTKFIGKVRPILKGIADSEFEINKHETKINGTEGLINHLWQAIRVNVRITSLAQAIAVHELCCSLFAWTMKKDGQGKENSKFKQAPKKVVQFFSDIKRVYRPHHLNGLVPPSRFEKTKENNKDVYVLESAKYDLFKEHLTYQDMLKALNESVLNNKSSDFKNSKDKIKLINTALGKLEREGKDKEVSKISNALDELCRNNNIKPKPIRPNKKASKVTIKNEDVKKVKMISSKICD
jgi:hypothetical protein